MTELTLQQFIRKHKITMKFKMVDNNPWMDKDAWAKTARHYKILLRRPGKRMTSYYSMGAGLQRDPVCEDILESLRMETQTIEHEGSFENWAKALGYDPDSRAAYRNYELSKKLSWKFVRFLGQDAYKDLLKTECL